MRVFTGPGSPASGAATASMDDRPENRPRVTVVIEGDTLVHRSAFWRAADADTGLAAGAAAGATS
jgi:hypothetical protein